jgi:hypothetical protein
MRCHGVGVLVIELNTPIAIGDKVNSDAHNINEV